MNIPSFISELPHIESVQVNGQVISARIPHEHIASVAGVLVHQHGLPLSLMYGTDDRAERRGFGVHAVFSVDQTHQWLVLSAQMSDTNPSYPSLTRTIMAAHWYERYLRDMFGVIPEGHPDLRRLVHHENMPQGVHPLRKDFAWDTRLPVADEPYPMHHVQGEGVYEIPVGPIHAGIIEPGHFRFNVAGERIITLEGKLFFTHKGVEKLLEGKTADEALPYIERISGDSAASHALAFCQAVEQVAGCAVPPRAARLRTLLAELERVTMHIHDLANIGGMGTGYTFLAAQGFRIKERLMRLSDRIVGNRFWRGMIIPGGCARDMDRAALDDILHTTLEAIEEMQRILDIALQSDGFRERLETSGILPQDAAAAFGAVGVAARASGIERDVRRDHPYAAYGQYPMPMASETSGDVYARYMVRVRELDESRILIQTIIKDEEPGPVQVPCKPREGFGMSAVESWRGELIAALHMKSGVVSRCVMRDPSFCNWALFGVLGPGNIVPDFPLCNKSLNLSYSGTDM